MARNMAALSRFGTRPGVSVSAGSAAPTDYRDIMAKLVDTLKPGGEIEKAYLAEAEQEGRQLAAQLNAASIARGLGNATNNAPVTAMRHVAKRKQEIHGNTLSQFLSALQFLANMSFQGEQAAASRAANMGPSNASRGLDVFGQPFASIAPQGGEGFSAAAFPSLAAAGGMGAATPVKARSLFGDEINTGSPFEVRQYGDPYWLGGRDVTRI